MKKIIYYVGIICSIVIILISVYTFINIYCIFSVVNGEMYDGFGTMYSYGEPNSPYTLLGFLEFVCGITLFRYCIKKIKYDVSENEIQNTSLENAEEVGDKNNTSNNSERGNKIYNIVFSTLVIIAIIGACFLGYLMYEEYQDTISNYEEQIDKLHSTISNKNQEVSKYIKKIDAMNSQISFMDSNVAICPNDGTGLYHKYNCEHLDLSSYFVYNTEQALSKGYKACQYCSNSSNTYTSYERFKEKVEQDEIVYITNTGSNYHREGCSYLKSKNAITKKKAQNQGYTACSRCRP